MTSIGNTPASYIANLMKPTGPVFYGRAPGIGPEDTDEAADAILKIVNKISVETTAASKAAAAKIGDAALSAVERWEMPNHSSSEGVRYYERPEDIEDPEYRARMIDLAKKETAQKAIDAVTPGYHRWPEQMREGEKIFCIMMDYFKSDFSYTTGKTSGGDVIEQSNTSYLNFLGSLREKIATLTAGVAEVADITGKIVSQGADGQLRIGKFEARDKITGQLFMKMDDQNMLRFYDQGAVLLDVDFGISNVEQ
ncbi:hypothetical protein [Methylobacterium aquaticum]|uniref:hypothetical protein n=1 Tax=Methylobacterium aquaticum TaxID=270351 RepID=UPI001931FE74|nr:hypothetical protein [Methylobacterium aquaticum]QRE73871.1 hypothetical protein F1D61_09780 [Methylobacterium aquaticum]